MNVRTKKFLPFIISVATVLTATILIITSVASCSAGTLTFKASFYFVCYAVKDNSVSASSISGAVSSYGGAGYILDYGGAYYVTVSCYYRESDALTVCESLKKRDMNCTVLTIDTDSYTLKTRNAKNNSKLYLGNLNTLNNLSAIAYECANALDTGEYDQTKAKAVIADVYGGLGGLLSANADNCFTGELRRLSAICADAGEGYIYSKDLRKLQIAIADTIINADLY